MIVNNQKLRSSSEQARAKGRNLQMRLKNNNSQTSAGVKLPLNARLANRNTNMTNCRSKTSQIGCDAQRFQRFQLECGLYARMLQLNRITGDGNTGKWNSLLCVASPGAGKTLAQWCVCINWCVFEALNSMNQIMTILMVADDEQVKGQANEVPKLVPLLHQLLKSSNDTSNDLLSKESITRFLDNLPSKKTILQKGNVKREVKGSHVGSTVLPPFVGKHSDLDVRDRILVDLGENGLTEQYEKIKDTVYVFYGSNLVPWVDTCLQNNGSALNTYKLTEKQDVLKKLKHLQKRLKKADSKWENVMNLNAYIQTIIEIARGGTGKTPVLGNVKRLEGDKRRNIQRGDIVRFFLKNTFKSGKASQGRPTPFYYVNYWRTSEKNVPQDVLVTPLCNSSDDTIANLPQYFGWQVFIQMFNLDWDNVYRFEYVPNAQVSIVDQPLRIGRTAVAEKKMYDLSSDNVIRLLNDKYNVKYNIKESESIWWMRYGSFRPRWWKEYPETQWPTETGSRYPHHHERGVRQALPLVLIVGMNHTDFNKLRACSNKKAWESTLIICDEIHQFEEKKAADTLRHAISRGAKSVDFTATPYYAAEDFAVLCGTLGGKKVEKPKSYMKGQATKYAKEHGVLVYQHDMTNGEYNSLMPSLYPNLGDSSMSEGAGRINVQMAALNYARNGLVNTTFSGVVDPSIDPSKQSKYAKKKYPFERVSSKPKLNAKSNGTFLKKGQNNAKYYSNNNGNGNYSNKKKINDNYNVNYSNNNNNGNHSKNNGNGNYSNNKNIKNNGNGNDSNKKKINYKAAEYLTFKNATASNRKQLKTMHTKIMQRYNFNENANLTNTQYAPLKKTMLALKKKRAEEKKQKEGQNVMRMFLGAMK